MPVRLTGGVVVATPDAFVVAVTTLPPFSRKLTVLPPSGVPSLFFSVADRVVVPPKVPDAASTLSVEADRLLIVTDSLPLDAALCLTSPAYAAVRSCLLPLVGV